MTFLRQDADPIQRRVGVGPTSRLNIDVGSIAPELDGTSFGALVESTNGTPIVVEHSMYWTALGAFWSGGASGAGMLLPPVTPP